MKIYKIWQDYNTGYDTYDSCVVIAKDMRSAKRLSIKELEDSIHFPTWVNDTHYLHAKEIGTTEIDKEQIVVASFNAG